MGEIDRGRGREADWKCLFKVFSRDPIQGADSLGVLILGHGSAIIAGREVYRDQRVVGVDEEQLRARLNEIARRLS